MTTPDRMDRSSTFPEITSLLPERSIHSPPLSMEAFVSIPLAVSITRSNSIFS